MSPLGMIFSELFFLNDLFFKTFVLVKTLALALEQKI